MVVAARGAVAVRGFAGAGEPTRAELRAAPVHWPRPSVLEVGLESLDGVGPKLAEAARAAGIATVGDVLYRFPHSHRDRQIRPLEALEPGETGTVMVQVLGNPPRPFRRGKLTMVGVKVGDETDSVRATWFNQPWVSGKLEKGSTVLITGKRSPKGLAVQEWELVAVCDRDLDRARRVVGGTGEVLVPGDVADVLARDDIDAVAIATPAGTHATLALAAHCVMVLKWNCSPVPSRAMSSDARSSAFSTQRACGVALRNRSALSAK